MNWKLTIAASSLLLMTAACQRESVAGTTAPAAPPNEVWLTSKQIKQAGIGTAVVTAQPMGATLTATGRVAFTDTRVGHVFSPVTGRVTNCLVSLGQTVERGSALAVIQSPDLGTAVSDLEKAEADLAAAERELERQKELYEGHAAAQRDYEAAVSNHRKAKAERQRAAEKSKLLLPSRGSGGQEYVLRAPIRGEVVARNVSLGMEVQGQYSGGNATELFTIGDTNPVWVLADVFEVDLPRVRIGAPAVVNVVAFPGRRFTGRVDWIAGSLDPGTRTAKVRCAIDNHDHALRPEMYATVSMATDTKQRLAVPRTAVVRLGDQMVVFVDKGLAPNGAERFERRIVAVDDSESAEYAEVTGGLTAGERVVDAGAIILSGTGQ